RNDDLFVTALAGTSLRRELDRIPLWRGDHVAIRQLVEDFARYLYLPRLREPAVLLEAIHIGLGLLTWQTETFAYADDFDQATARYRGLRSGEFVTVSQDSRTGLLVRPEIAERQRAADLAAAPRATGESTADGRQRIQPGSPAGAGPGIGAGT